MKLKNAFLLTTLSTASIVATSCTKVIGDAFNDKADINGSRPVVETLTCSKKPVNTVYIDASKLIPGKEYSYSKDTKNSMEERLVVNGDIPDEVSLRTSGVQLVIKGNVGYKAYISASLSYDSSKKLFPCYKRDANKKEDVSDICSWEERAPNRTYDKDPLIIIEGRVHETATVSSSSIFSENARVYFKQLESAKECVPSTQFKLN